MFSSSALFHVRNSSFRVFSHPCLESLTDRLAHSGQQSDFALVQGDDGVERSSPCAREGSLAVEDVEQESDAAPESILTQGVGLLRRGDAAKRRSEALAGAPHQIAA